MQLNQTSLCTVKTRKDCKIGKRAFQGVAYKAYQIINSFYQQWAIIQREVFVQYQIIEIPGKCSRCVRGEQYKTRKFQNFKANPLYQILRSVSLAKFLIPVVPSKVFNGRHPYYQFLCLKKKLWSDVVQCIENATKNNVIKSIADDSTE